MAKTPKTLQVSFGGFNCTLEGFEDPVGAMRDVTEYLRDLSVRDPGFADRIGLAVGQPPSAPPAPVRVELATVAAPLPPGPFPPGVPQTPPAPHVPEAAPTVAAVPLPPAVPQTRPAPPETAPEAMPTHPEPLRDSAPDPEIPPMPPEATEPEAMEVHLDKPEAMAAHEGKETEVEDESPVDPAAHPGLHRLLSATPESGEEEELSRILSRADDQLADPEAARRRGVLAQLKAAVVATQAERALGESDAGPQARQGAFRHDLTEVVRTQAPAPPRPEQAPLRLVASQRVDTPSEPPTVLDDEEEDAQDSLPVRRPGSFRVFASELSALSLPDLLEAAAAWLCFVDERESVSRGQLLALASEALEAAPEREEGLRAFGTLLREGRVAAVAGGRYRVSDSSRFHPARLAG